MKALVFTSEYGEYDWTENYIDGVVLCSIEHDQKLMVARWVAETWKPREYKKGGEIRYTKTPRPTIAFHEWLGTQPGYQLVKHEEVEQ